MPKLAIIATIEVASGKRNQLLPPLMAFRARSLKDEAGTLQFEALASRDDDTKVLVYEIYQDDAAFEAHLSGPPMAQFREQTGGMGMKISVTRCTPVE